MKIGFLILTTSAILALPALLAQSEPPSEPVIILDFNPTEGTAYNVRLVFDGWEVNRITTTNFFIDERDIFYSMRTNRIYKLIIAPVVLGEEVAVLRSTNDYHYKVTNEIMEPLPPRAPEPPKGVTIKD